MRAAVEERPSFVLVEGEGGSGKTALLRTFTARLGMGEVVRVTGDEGETGLPYGVLDQLLAQLPADAAETGSSEQDARSGDVGARDSVVEGIALLQRLALAQEPAPLVLLIDDAHLADGPSLRAVTFALRRLRTERSLVVVTVRPEGLLRLPPGLGRLIDGSAGRVSLGGLSTAEVQVLAAATGFGRLTERGAGRLREHTGGNPLHLRALMADLTAAQVESVGRPLPAPRSLALLVIAALAQAQQATRRLVAAAAVLGPRSRFQEIADLAGIGDLLPAVQELQEAGIADLVEHRQGRQLKFRHPLIRAAVYDDLGAATRADLHARAAGLCSGRAALRHRVAAAAGPDPELVKALTVQARGDRSKAAWGNAAETLLDAVQLSDPGPERGQLLLDAIELLLLDGDLTQAIGYAGQVADLPEDAHRLQVQARIAWLSGQHDQADAYAQAAWASASDLDPRARDDVAAMLCQMYILRSDGAGAARWADRALASGLLPARTAAATRAAGAIGLALIGRSQDGLNLLSDLPKPSPAAGYRPELGAQGMLRLWTDDLAGAHADLQASLPAPGRGPGMGMEPYRLVALGYLLETQYRRGDWASASALAEQAIALVEDTGQAWLTAWVHALAVLVPAARGQWTLAEQHLAVAQAAAVELRDGPSRAYTGNAAVHLAACRDDPSQVLTAAQWLLGDGRGANHEPGFLGWSVQHATALVQSGRFEDAAARLDGLEQIARTRGRRSRLAALARVRGELAAARRDATAARVAFDEALRVGDGAVDALEAAVAQAAYGRFLRRRGERRAAVQRLSRAQELFTALGALPFLARCTRELAACGVTPETPADRTHLTPQESAVAELVCAGRTNRQVADELVLSVKTVGYHLAHVYTKLEVNSRMELAGRLGITIAPSRT
jgi:ATP/maltotriose-dependent transcriptional regulator MalT